MDSPPAWIRAWAQRLVASEAANKSASDAAPELPRFFEKLRSALTQFFGADGFTALMRRALALARKEVASLETAKVTPEGRLEVMEDHRAGTNYAEAATAITAHLLALLVTF